jgi:hypothetical protein
MKEVTSIKATNTWAMSIAVICVGLHDLAKQGLDAVENSVNTQLLISVNEAAAKLPKD